MYLRANCLLKFTYDFTEHAELTVSTILHTNSLNSTGCECNLFSEGKCSMIYSGRQSSGANVLAPTDVKFQTFRIQSILLFKQRNRQHHDYHSFSSHQRTLLRIRCSWMPADYWWVLDLEIFSINRVSLLWVHGAHDSGTCDTTYFLLEWSLTDASSSDSIASDPVIHLGYWVSHRNPAMSAYSSSPDEKCSARDSSTHRYWLTIMYLEIGIICRFRVSTLFILRILREALGWYCAQCFIKEGFWGSQFPAEQCLLFTSVFSLYGDHISIVDISNANHY